MMTIQQKLLKVQEEIGVIKKDATNPFFKSKYFDINSLLEQVKPVLNRNGLVLLQALTNIDGKLALATEIINTENKESIRATCPLPETIKAQEAGSAITYFRRYALQSLLALEAEDDDGNIASTKVENKQMTNFKKGIDRMAGIPEDEIDFD